MINLKKSTFRLSAIVFLILFSATIYFTYNTYRLAKVEEESRAHELLDAAKNRLQQLLNSSTSTTQLLAFLVKEYQIQNNFDLIAKRIFETQKYVDAIQLVPNGVICCVYPLKGNEAAIGYNILTDKTRNIEALEAIARKELYFAGPLELRQGGMAVVGRLPIFFDEKFWGFSAVLIKLETLIEATGLDTISNREYYFGLSKVNPNTTREEYFISDSLQMKSAYATDLIVHNGEWRLSVVPKDVFSAVKSMIPVFVIGTLLSGLGALLVWTLVRLPSILSRTLEERSQSLKDSELKYIDLYNHSPVMLMSVNMTDQKIIDCNSTLLKVTGFTNEEIGKKTVSEFYHPDSLNVAREAIYNLFEKGESPAKEFKIFNRQGKVLYVLQTISTIKNDEGKISFARFSWQDITDKKLAEQYLELSENKFAQLADNISQVFYISDLKKQRIEYISPAFEKVWGMSINTVYANPLRFLDAVIEEDRHLVNEALEKQAKGEFSEVHYRIRRPDGHVRYIYSRGYPVKNNEGEYYRIAGIAEDVTDTRVRELVMSGEKKVLEMIAVGVALPDILQNIAENFEKYSSGSLCSVLLLSEDGKRVHHGAGPSLPKEFINGIDGQDIGPRAGSCGTAAYLKKQVIVTDIENDPLWKKYKDIALPHGLRACWSTPIIGNSGEVLGTFAIYYREVRAPEDFDFELIERATYQTKIAIEKARFEEKLKQSEEQFSAAFESNVVGLSISSADRRIVAINPSMAAIFGKTVDEMVGKTSMEAGLVSSRFLDGNSQSLIEYVSEHGAARNVEIELTMVDGEKIPVLASISQINFNGAQHWLSTFMDISHRKKMEHDLLQSENHLRTIIETEPECIKELDREGNLISMNPAGLKMIEADSLAQVKGKPVNALILNEYKQAFDDLNRRVFQGGSGSLEFKIKGIRGTIRWLETNAVPFRDSNGEITSMLGITRDITERKNAELALRKSLQRNKAFVDAIPDLIFILNEKGEFLDYNTPEGVSTFTAPDNFLGKRVDEIMPGKLGMEILMMVKKTLETGDLQEHAYQLPDPNGEVRSFEARYVRSSASEVFAIVRDVTQLKSAERELLQSKTALEFAEEYANLGNWEFDLTTMEGRWSKQMYRMFGFDLNSTVPTFDDYLKHIHSEDRSIVDEALNKMRKGLEPPLRIFRTNPDILPLRYFKPTYLLQRDKLGKPIKFSGTVLDITTLRLREEALKESETKYRTIFENTSEGIYRCTVEGELLLANPSFVQIFGYTSENEMKEDVKDIGQYLYAEPGDRQKLMSEILLKGYVNKVEVKAKTKLGDFIWISVNAHLAYSVGKTIEYIEGTITDISERKLSRLKIDEQYDALRRYAFINSHEVRAHVATLLGLSNLFNSDRLTDAEKGQIINLMRDETSGLDTVIRKLSNIINEVE